MPHAEYWIRAGSCSGTKILLTLGVDHDLTNSTAVISPIVCLQSLSVELTAVTSILSRSELQSWEDQYLIDSCQYLKKGSPTLEGAPAVTELLNCASTLHSKLRNSKHPTGV